MIKDKIRNNAHLILIFLCALFCLNLITMCNVNKNLNKLEKTVIDKNTEFSIYQKNNFELLNAEIDKKLCENLLENKLLFENKLKIDTISNKLKTATQKIIFLKREIKY